MHNVAAMGILAWAFHCSSSRYSLPPILTHGNTPKPIPIPPHIRIHVHVNKSTCLGTTYFQSLIARCLRDFMPRYFDPFVPTLCAYTPTRLHVCAPSHLPTDKLAYISSISGYYRVRIRHACLQDSISRYLCDACTCLRAVYLHT